MSSPRASIDSLISFRNSQGTEARGTLLKLTRTGVVFEVYNPYSIVQLSEVLEECTIRRGDRLVYFGRAIVTNLVNTGLMLIVSGTLLDAWRDLSGIVEHSENIRAEVDHFLSDWREAHKLLAGYQLVIGELRSFMSHLSRWLEHTDADLHSQEQREIGLSDDAFSDLAMPLLPVLQELFERFELEAKKIPSDKSLAHKSFAQRDLHPLVMRAPFVYRIFSKPLGYAGDYQMVRMMLADKREGPTTYAQIINSFALQIGPVRAHRHRIEIIEKLLEDEAEKAAATGKRLRILNVGCGPAVEVERFIRNSTFSSVCNFELIDFNEETIEHARTNLLRAKVESNRDVELVFTHQSVHGLLREASSALREEQKGAYELIYCAGLFDYLTDRVCARLIRLFTQWAVHSGRVVATNVHRNNPSQYLMEHITEWYLVHRSEQEMLRLAPENCSARTFNDKTGINIFLDIRIAKADGRY